MGNKLRYNGYTAVIRFSAEDEVFFGRLLTKKNKKTGMRDLVLFEATSVRGLKKAFRETVNDYIETCNYVAEGKSIKN